jgi:serine/threonine protein kinase
MSIIASAKAETSGSMAASAMLIDRILTGFLTKRSLSMDIYDEKAQEYLDKNPTPFVCPPIAVLKKNPEKNKGKNFGDIYKTSRLIGHGAFAKVMVCSHKDTNTKYAVKTVQKNAEDPAKQKEGNLYFNWSLPSKLNVFFLFFSCDAPHAHQRRLRVALLPCQRMAAQCQVEPCSVPRS